jgi:hypothetical protein
MRTLLLVSAVVPLCIVVACAAKGKSYTDDDDASGGWTATGGAGGTASTSTTNSTNSPSTTTNTQTTTTTAGPSCYAGKGACDPLQPSSCATAGAACDIDTTNQFVCFDPPNTAGKGAPCDAQAGPYCMMGLTCVSNGTSSTCASFCCTGTDCGGGTCDSIGTAGSIDVKVCSA